MRYVLGVDGGNTKTDYMLFGTDGSLVRHIRHGSISHEALPDSFDGTKRLLNAHVAEILEGLVSPKEVTAALGLAGHDLPNQAKRLNAIISEIGFSRFEAANDGILGIKAEASHGYGICSINGTGTVAVGIDPKGTFRQVSGVLPFGGDEGGGGVLASETAKCVYNELFRFGSQTKMTGKLFNLLGITDKQRFQEAYLTQVGMNIRHRQVSDILLESAEEGDREASVILTRAGTEMAKSAAGCANELSFDGCAIDVIMAGSMWVKPKTQIMKNAFKSEFRRLVSGDVNFITLNMPPASGAVLWALELENGEFPHIELKEKVMRQVQDIKM